MSQQTPASSPAVPSHASFHDSSHASSQASLRAVIVDDDHKPRALLRRALAEHFPQIAIVAEANSVETALEALRSHRPDIAFLDVDLTYGTSFDVLDALTAPDDPEFAIMFVTAFEEYAIKAIEYSALGYIVKPVSGEELRRKVQKMLDRLFPTPPPTEPLAEPLAKPLAEPSVGQVAEPVTEPLAGVRSVIHPLVNPLADKIALPLASSKSKQLVPLAEVLYCEAQSNYTMFRLASGANVVVAKTLKDYEAQLLPKGFIRIHRSHIVNLAHLVELQRDGNALYVRLAGVKEALSVARMFQEHLLDLLH
jgi:two-component system, LytTR family, response regulator